MARFKIVPFILIVVGLILNGCTKKPAEKPDLTKLPEYAGSEACKECHAKIYETFQGTLHPRMIQDAKKNPNAILGDFENENVVRTFTRKDIIYTIGNQWNQLYITKIGGDYFILPASLSIATGEWRPSRADIWKLPEESWTNKCAGCHVTGFKPASKKWVELGIGCEACHGPGSNHIKAMKWKKANPGKILLSEGSVPTIINPAKLPSGLAAMICGSCHSRGKSRFGAFPYAVAFRAGGSLNLIFELTPDSPEKARDQKQAEEIKKQFWPNGFAKDSRQQYTDWLKSRHAHEGVGCATCHTVHAAGKGNRYQTKLPGSILCQSCHQLSQHRVQSHSIHDFAECIGCHMPQIVGREGHFDRHSHTFRAISPAETIKAGGVDKLPNSCNTCHYHKDDPPEKLQEVLDRIKENAIKR